MKFSHEVATVNLYENYEDCQTGYGRKKKYFCPIFSKITEDEIFIFKHDVLLLAFNN